MRSVYVGIDQGTRSTRSVIIDSQGRSLFSARVAVALNEISLEEIEQDPIELLNSVRQVLNQALAFARDNNLTIVALGLATQRSGVCAWDKRTGEAVSPLISWADTRTRKQIDRLGSGKDLISRKTSLPPLAHYAAGKISLLQERFQDPEILVGTLDSFLLWQLDPSRPFVTDDTMAARTMLYSLESGAWDSQLAGLFNVSVGRLAEIRPTIDGQTRCSIKGIPVTALIGDQQSAFLSHSQRAIDCLINFGSIISLLVPTGERKVNSAGFVTSILCSRSSGSGRTCEYLIEGVSNAAARVVDYLIKDKGYITDSIQIDECCRRSLLSGSDKQLFLPLGGTGAPDWLDHVPAHESGEMRASNDDYVRAAMENIAGFVIRQIDIFKQRGILPPNPVIAISGGLSQSRYLLDFIAECCQVPLYSTESSEATVTGAAWAASAAFNGRNVGWRLDSCLTIPIPQESGARERHQRWLKLYATECARK